MYKKLVLFFWGSVLYTSVDAQSSNLVLCTIADKPIYASEFERAYQKNVKLFKDNSEKDIDEYLDLYIDYKLKLEEAKTLKLDKKESYIQELNTYKNQLKKKYLTDSQATEVLIKEAYDRSLERIRASHILITIKPNASAEDTAIAYQKITEARDKILAGSPFSVIAKTYSQDPSVVKNKGDLGWFSVFRMVYPFENAAYNTPVGKVSMPFRTQFGYHIVRVNAREKKEGEITVAHIMVAANKNRNSDQAKTKIYEISQQISQGASFASLAKQYSDDPSTAIQGGRLRRFEKGELSSYEFEKAAFGLKEKNEVSQPVKTQYGWHIIKLIDKHPLKKFESQKQAIAQKIKRDNRSKQVTTSFIKSLKEKYKVSKNEAALSYFKKIENEYTKNWMLPKKEAQSKNVLTIHQQKYTYEDFAAFLKSNKNQLHQYPDYSIYIDTMYKRYESLVLLKYYEEHLEKDNQEYAEIVQEYRDGLLLFDLMQSKIWDAARIDSVGLKKYYEKHKEKYVQNQTYKTLKASSVKENAIKKVEQLLQAGVSVGNIKKKINNNDVVLVIFSEEEWEQGVDTFPKEFPKKIGQTITMRENNVVTLIKLIAIVPSRVKLFKEIKGEIINDFQKNKERQWLNELRIKYPVKMDKKVIKKIKAEVVISSPE